jgi:hypothetical protein
MNESIGKTSQESKLKARGEETTAKALLSEWASSSPRASLAFSALTVVRKPREMLGDLHMRSASGGTSRTINREPTECSPVKTIRGNAPVCPRRFQTVMPTKKKMNMGKKLKGLALLDAAIVATAGSALATPPEGFASTTTARGQFAAFDVSNYFVSDKGKLWLSWQKTKGKSDGYFLPPTGPRTCPRLLRKLLAGRTQWEPSWSGENGPHPRMGQSACTRQVTASRKRKTRLRMDGRLLGS